MPQYGKGHDNIDDAAAAASFVASRQPRVADQEYMTILERAADDLYYRREFQTEGKWGTSSWSGHLTPGNSLAGLLHTHPLPKRMSKVSQEAFSTTDTDNQDVPSYLAVIKPEGPAVGLRYRPGETDMAPWGERQRGTGSYGEPYLAKYPMDEHRQYMMRDILGRQPDDPRGLMMEGGIKPNPQGPAELALLRQLLSGLNDTETLTNNK